MENIASVKAFFDERAQDWDKTCIHDPRKISAIVTLAQIMEGCKLLDIACGTGVLFPEALSRGPEAISGVDLSERMIEIARKKCTDPRVRTSAMDFLEFDENGFDVAIIYCAYPHFLDKAALIRHVYDRLTPGGRFMVAHSESRDTINGRHHGAVVQEVSESLLPAASEAELWKSHFAIDLMADNSDIYLFSGLKIGGQ